MFEHRRKSREEVEVIALTELRKDRDRRKLNNTNVDCYVDGFFKAQSILTPPNQNTREFMVNVLDELSHRYENIHLTAGYSGRNYTGGEVVEREMINNLITKIKEVIGDGNNKEN